jgi:hypothetical protein
LFDAGRAARVARTVTGVDPAELTRALLQDAADLDIDACGVCAAEPYAGTERLIRGDLFHNQPCPTDPPTYEYTYLGPIFGLDYWACHRFDSDHL